MTMKIFDGLENFVDKYWMEMIAGVCIAGIVASTFVSIINGNKIKEGLKQQQMEKSTQSNVYNMHSGISNKIYNNINNTLSTTYKA